MFEHSVPVPRLYKLAAKLLHEVKENGSSTKQQLYSKVKHTNIKGIYALVAKALEHFSEIDALIQKSQLLEKEHRLDPWLARILIYELLWKGKKLGGECKPFKTILSYRAILEEHKSSLNNENKKTIKKVEKPRYVRINTLTCTVEEAINEFRDEGWKLVHFTGKNYDEFLSKVATLEWDEFMIDLHVKEILLFPAGTAFYNHRAYKAGSIVLQDKASCLPVRLLNAPSGSTVLDMCAAPGMKTSYLAALLNDQGTIYAVERDKDRFNTLNMMVENLGATCIKTINQDVLKIGPRQCPNIEYILVDPSCSGSGMTSRLTIDGKKEKPNPGRLEKLSGLQIIILKHALTHFPQAKRVVYSTCSVYPQENQYVVSEVLKYASNFKLVSAKNLLNGTWRDLCENDYISECCISTTLEKDFTNGFFIAVFERDESRIQKESENELQNQKKRNKAQKYNTSNEFESMNNKEEISGNRQKQKNKRKVDKPNYNENLQGELYGKTLMTKQEDLQINATSAKKKNKTNTNHDDEENEAPDEIPIIKKKAKKDTSNATKLNINLQAKSQINEAPPKKKKKRDKSTEDEGISHFHGTSSERKTNIADEEISGFTPNLSKKKKSKKHNSNLGENQQVPPTEEISTKASKKKEKHKENKANLTENQQHNTDKNNTYQESKNSVPKITKPTYTKMELELDQNGAIGLEAFTNMLNASNCSFNNTTVKAAENDSVTKKNNKKKRKIDLEEPKIVAEEVNRSKPDIRKKCKKKKQ